MGVGLYNPPEPCCHQAHEVGAWHCGRCDCVPAIWRYRPQEIVAGLELEGLAYEQELFLQRDFGVTRCQWRVDYTAGDFAANARLFYDQFWRLRFEYADNSDGSPQADEYEFREKGHPEPYYWRCLSRNAVPGGWATEPLVAPTFGIDEYSHIVLEPWYP